MRSGYIVVGNSRLELVGNEAFYWIPRASSNTNYARYLGFGTSDANMIYDSNRYFGYSLRCLSTVLDR